MAKQKGDADLLVWMQLLRDYAKDWDRTFDNRDGYFTQEYWYLFVGCLLRYWSGAPASVSDRLSSRSNERPERCECYSSFHDQSRWTEHLLRASYE